MTGLPPGFGGLPPVRPDQQFTPPPNVTAPGGAAGVVRARQVIITGGKNAGIFVYAPSPGLGTLIGSWTAAAGIDGFGNAYPQGLNVSVGQVSGILLSATELTVSEGPVLFYGNPSASNIPFGPGAAGNFTVPAGITSLTESFLGGSGTATAGTGAAGGNGAGGAEAVVVTRTVIPGQVIPYSVGTATHATVVDGVSAAPGGNATASLAGTGGTSVGAGTRFKGGNGALQSGIGFGGAGGSGAGFTQAGNPAVTFTPGAAPPSGGGAGGAGGGALLPSNGQDGFAPGGGPGGGLKGSGAAGAPSGGSLVFSYSSTLATALLLSISSSAGSDNFGNSWTPGLTVFGNTILKSGLQISTGAAAHALLASDASGNASWNTGVPLPAISNAFSNANWTALINALVAANLMI